MALKTATVPNRQNVGWRNSKDFADIVKKLAADNALIVKGEEAKKRVVKIVDDFVAKLKREEKAEARKELCKKAGIVLRTFERWKAEGEQRAEIGETIYAKAEEMGYEITPSSTKSLADAKRLNPGKTPAEIVKIAAKSSQDREPRVKAEPIQEFVEALNTYLRNANNDADGILQAIKNAAIPREKICAALKGLCREN